MEINTVFIVGSGLMGNGIAQVTAAGGYQVILQDISDEVLAKGVQSIKTSLSRFVKKGKLTEDEKVAVLGRIRTTTTLDLAAEAQLVIEAVPENAELKMEIFRKLDKICPPDTIFTSNTSAIPISKLSTATERGPLFIGTHFFSPVPMMRLVEIVMGVSTVESTLEIIKEYCTRIGKDTIVCRKDTAGFLLNRIGMPMTMEAIRCVEEGAGTPEDIDKGFRLAFNYPMGPLELIDFTGIDTTMNAAFAMYQDHGNPKFFPPPLMQRMVQSGWCGRKTGRGFYDYSQSNEKK